MPVLNVHTVPSCQPHFRYYTCIVEAAQVGTGMWISGRATLALPPLVTPSGTGWVSGSMASTTLLAAQVVTGGTLRPMTVWHTRVALYLHCSQCDRQHHSVPRPRTLRCGGCPDVVRFYLNVQVVST